MSKGPFSNIWIEGETIYWPFEPLKDQTTGVRLKPLKIGLLVEMGCTNRFKT